MEYRSINEEVLYPKTKFVSLKAEDLGFLKAQASRNLRQRARLCTHQGPEDKVHEMFIVHGKNTYVRPHRHLKRVESFFLIDGEADAIFFNEKGQVTRRMEMGTMGSGKQFYYRLNEPVYHTLIVKSETISFLEVTNGPFVPEDTEFPSWAPDGLDQSLAKQYIQELGKVQSCA